MQKILNITKKIWSHQKNFDRDTTFNFTVFTRFRVFWRVDFGRIPYTLLHFVYSSLKSCKSWKEKIKILSKAYLSILSSYAHIYGTLQNPGYHCYILNPSETLIGSKCTLIFLAVLFLFLFFCVCILILFFCLCIIFNCILFNDISDSMPLKSSPDISKIVIGVFLDIFIIIFPGNFVCDIMRAATQTDIAILNSGSLRSDTIHPSGPFKMKVINNLLYTIIVSYDKTHRSV